MKELWLFTEHYPTGTMEVSVGHELQAFAKRFRRVRVFPLFQFDGVRALPQGASMEVLVPDPYAVATPWQIVRHWGPWTTLQRAVRRSAPSAEVFRARHPEVRSRMRQALHRALVIRRTLAPEYDPARVVLHSNWTSDWATALGLWKCMDPRVRFFSRMRGFDLFDHRVPDNWQVFQSFQLAQAAHLYPVSAAGRDDIVRRYPQHAAKITVSHTATFDHGPAPWAPDPAFRIVSCGNLIPIKRMHLLAEALALVQRPVHWTHFGDGSERDRIAAIVARSPAHVEVTLAGAVKNEDLLAFYAHRPVDLFIHLSETEGGVAVALQEAASFGIPLLAADAGGVRELVNAHTGELMPHELSPAAVAAHINAWMDRGHDATFRQGVRAHWKAHFEATRVHDRFARDLHDR